MSYSPPRTYINQLVVAGDPSSITGDPIHIVDVQGIGIQNAWNQVAGDGQTLDGTMVVEMSDHPNAHIDPTGTGVIWTDITSIVTLTDPTAGAGSNAIFIKSPYLHAMRLRVTGITGDGRFESYMKLEGTTL